MQPTIKLFAKSAETPNPGQGAPAEKSAIVRVLDAPGADDDGNLTTVVNAVAVSGSVTAPAEVAASWEWHCTGETWKPYPPEVSAKLEAAYAAGGSLRLDVDATHTHYVDTYKMRQVRHDDHLRHRRVRRVAGGAQRFLPVADKVVAGIPSDQFNAKYKPATDHAEGKLTMETMESSRRNIESMEHRLPAAELISNAHEPPKQDVAAIVNGLPIGMRSVVPGASHPERMTSEAVWNDNRDHFTQDKTVPQQLADEQRNDMFQHTSAAQFEQGTRLMKEDLSNRPHLEAADFKAPLESAETAAKPWQEKWQVGYDTLTVLGGNVLGPTEECLQKLDLTLKEQYRTMEAEHQLIKAATNKLARASTKVTELGDLGRKAKGDPTDEALAELMAKHGFHDVSTVRGRIIGEKKKAEKAVREARKGLLDALDHAVGVNTSCIEAVKSLTPEFQAISQTVTRLASEKAEEYRRKAKHIRLTMDRIAAKKTEVGVQRREVEKERNRDAATYAGEVDRSQRDNEADRQAVQKLLARIEAREQRIRDATREDQESAWKAQVLIGTLDENERVLDACSAEISDAPEILDRCCNVASTMGHAAKKLISELCENAQKDVTRRKSGGHDLDVRHFEEHTVARKKVFTEQIQTELMIFKCEQAIKAASQEMEDAEQILDEDLYAEQEEKEAKAKEQLARHQQNITGVFAEKDDLDKMIVQVVDRFQPLYTDPSLETAGKAQRTRIEATDAHAPWKRQDPAALGKAGKKCGVPDAAGCLWEPVLPAYELERQVREVIARQASRRERVILERQQEAAADKARFYAGLAPELTNGAAPGA